MENSRKPKENSRRTQDTPKWYATQARLRSSWQEVRDHVDGSQDPPVSVQTSCAQRLLPILGPAEALAASAEEPSPDRETADEIRRQNGWRDLLAKLTVIVVPDLFG